MNFYPTRVRDLLAMLASMLWERIAPLVTFVLVSLFYMVGAAIVGCLLTYALEKL